MRWLNGNCRALVVEPHRQEVVLALRRAEDAQPLVRGLAEGGEFEIADRESRDSRGGLEFPLHSGVGRRAHSLGGVDVHVSNAGPYIEQEIEHVRRIVPGDEFPILHAPGAKYSAISSSSTHVNAAS